MGKSLLIVLMCVLIGITGLLTGCMESDSSKIDGVLVNDTDQDIKIDFTNDVTDDSWYVGVGDNSSFAYKLAPGKYTITASYSSRSDYPDEFIDSVGLNLLPTDDTYMITVDATYVLAWSE